MKDELLFHLTGLRGGALAPIDGRGLRPALFARFPDLTRLRYGFPLVLADDGETPPVRALSDVFDELLAAVTAGSAAGERSRRRLLGIERGIRRLSAAGTRATLGALWDSAADALTFAGEGAPGDDLALAREALEIDGDVVDCDGAVARRFVRHAWGVIARRKASTMRSHCADLVARLAEIVRADGLRSSAGRRADALREGLGPPHARLFDLELMAHLLATPSGAGRITERRRRRIVELTRVLLVAVPAAPDPGAFIFDDTEMALSAHRGRLAAMTRLMRAIATARLEVAGTYDDEIHDAQLGQRLLAADDLALFPDHLVFVSGGAGDAPARQVFRALTSGAPLKVVLEADDPLGPDARIATSAMGLGNVFVVQASAARLEEMWARILDAIAYPGPALVSIFAGDPSAAVPAYLAAAAATEARAFPTFSYDPQAGPGWAERFTLADPPGPAAWRSHELVYADEALQRTAMALPFTPVDLALADARRTRHFAEVPRQLCGPELVPVAKVLTGEAADDAVPVVYAVDANDRLRTLLVDQTLIDAAREVADAWRRLVEIDAFGRQLVAAPAQVGAAVAAPVDAVVPAAEREVPSQVAERSGDEPYIETARCSSCNECTLINPRMFRYDGNKQAYLADLSAGSYRELVEAAESCQVAIIHPGKPRDPNEPGLDELLERAAALA